ncbi:hypothetical protein MNBD_GAMMA07-2790 [hydrothermal vent metagenome]|uniref:Type IV pilin accessory protein n=1 Tax=hydrothermal vent metagenome TaxID=652676 RepID=A0A3B0XJC1_9ZZZZ
MIISKPRIKAFSIHLLLSVSAISVFLYFVYFIWYPFPFDYFYTPFDVLKIVLGVDLVLGPLLTLVLYDIKKQKSELRKDIAIVVLIQLMAFMWGVHVTYSTRPVFLIFSNAKFYMFAKDELDLTLLKRQEMQPKFWKTAAYVYLDPPKDKKELERLYDEFERGEKPYYRRRTERYLPLAEGFKSLTQYSINMDNAIKDKTNKQKIDNFLANKSGSIDQYVFFMSIGANKVATLVFNRETGKLEGVMPVL